MSEVTGLDMPEVQKALDTLTKTLKASRIEIQLKGSQYIKVHFDEVTEISETNENFVKG